MHSRPLALQHVPKARTGLRTIILSGSWWTSKRRVFTTFRFAIATLSLHLAGINANRGPGRVGGHRLSPSARTVLRWVHRSKHRQDAWPRADQMCRGRRHGTGLPAGQMVLPDRLLGRSGGAAPGTPALASVTVRPQLKGSRVGRCCGCLRPRAPALYHRLSGGAVLAR